MWCGHSYACCVRIIWCLNNKLCVLLCLSTLFWSTSIVYLSHLVAGGSPLQFNGVCVDRVGRLDDWWGWFGVGTMKMTIPESNGHSSRRTINETATPSCGRNDESSTYRPRYDQSTEGWWLQFLYASFGWATWGWVLSIRCHTEQHAKHDSSMNCHLF